MEAHAVVMCDCDWLMTLKEDQQLCWCDNPRCDNRGKLYRMQFRLEPVKEVQDGIGNHDASRSC